MTQTSPKPDSQNISNDRIALDKIAQVGDRTSANYPGLSSQKQSAQKQTKQKSGVFQRLSQGWENLNFRSKLTLLLVGGIALPVIAVTQGMVKIAQGQSIRSLEAILQSKLFLLEEKIKEEKIVLRGDATALALEVQTAKVDFNNPDKVSAYRQQLQDFVASIQKEDSNRSFYIITDAQGRTIVQHIQVGRGG